MPDNDTFQGYVVTTNNPGSELLIITFFTIIGLYLLGFSFAPSSPFFPKYKRIYESLYGSVQAYVKNIKEGNLWSSSSSTTHEYDDDAERPTLRPPFIGNRSTKNMRVLRSNRMLQQHSQKEGLGNDPDEVYDPNAKNYLPPLNNIEKTDEIDKISGGNFSDNLLPKEMDSLLINELSEVFKLAIPWMISSWVGFAANLVSISMITHFLGSSAMVTYIIVWFVVYLLHVINEGLYESCYKHMNNALGVDTVESYHLAGRYLSTGVLLNLIISIPSSFVSVYFMQNIVIMFGYDDIQLLVDCQTVASVVVIQNLVDTTARIIISPIDIIGYANFNAIFDFFENVASIGANVIFIYFVRPSITELVIFMLVFDIFMWSIYFWLAQFRNRWFDDFFGGQENSDNMNFKNQGNQVLLKSLLKKTIYYTIETIAANIEWAVLSMFAAHQGSAEAATWILLNNIWSIVNITPENYSTAVATRLSQILSRGDIKLAKKLCDFSIVIVIFSSYLCAYVTYRIRDFIIWCLSVDDTLQMMLYEVIPYIVLSTPFIAFGSLIGNFNYAFCNYLSSTKVMLASSCIVTIPTAAFMTYTLNLNMEGLASALILGCVSTGVVNFILYLHANWDKAVRKNQEVVTPIELSVC